MCTLERTSQCRRGWVFWLIALKSFGFLTKDLILTNSMLMYRHYITMHSCRPAQLYLRSDAAWGLCWAAFLCPHLSSSQLYCTWCQGSVMVDFAFCKFCPRFSGNIYSFQIILSDIIEQGATSCFLPTPQLTVFVNPAVINAVTCVSHISIFSWRRTVSKTQ